MKRRALRALIPAACAVALAAGCQRIASFADPSEAETQAQRGAVLIAAFGCGSCHTVPGVRGAAGKVAPPLDDFAERAFIAGELPNTPDNLVRWLQNPPAVEPGTAMPALGLSRAQAQDIAAYLLTLR